MGWNPLTQLLLTFGTKNRQIGCPKRQPFLLPYRLRVAKRLPFTRLAPESVRLAGSASLESCAQFPKAERPAVASTESAPVADESPRGLCADCNGPQPLESGHYEHGLFRSLQYGNMVFSWHPLSPSESS